MQRNIKKRWKSSSVFRTGKPTRNHGVASCCVIEVQPFADLPKSAKVIISVHALEHCSKSVHATNISKVFKSEVKPIPSPSKFCMERATRLLRAVPLRYGFLGVSFVWGIEKRHTCRILPVDVCSACILTWQWKAYLLGALVISYHLILVNRSCFMWDLSVICHYHLAVAFESVAHAACDFCALFYPGSAL